MGIIQDLQIALAEDKPIGPILMKLRLVAAKLGSHHLEEWVKFEAEGYPQGFQLPDYRILAMAFIGQFSGPFGSGIKDAPIPPYLIGKIAGEKWVHFQLRQSAASVDCIVEEGNGLNLDLSDLSLLIQGQVYENMACNQLSGYISHSAIVEATNAIRNRLLALTIELERQIPDGAELTLSSIPAQSELTTQIYYQTIHGGLTQIHNSGENQKIAIAIQPKNYDSLLEALSDVGLSDEHAETLAKLISEEKPTTSVNEASLGHKTRKWIADRISQGVDATVKGGSAALVKLVQDAAMQFWGLK